MVRLDRIYTRSGDTGQTSLGDGSRVPKISGRIAAGGMVDELNCFIGLAASTCDSPKFRDSLQALQQQLFDLGADLTCPLPHDSGTDRCPRIGNRHTLQLESQIDVHLERLAPLTSFILPGGTFTASTLHLARAVCRRAELAVLRLQDEASAQVNPEIAIYLNRLSDLLFVLARCANDDGQQDVLWQPGRADPSE